MSGPGARLLVVDDNDDNRYTLLRRLAREGHEDIVAAAGGREALEIIRSQPIDLVLLDVMMPDMNGYDVLEVLKRDPVLRELPVIMISALEEVDSVVRCIELGAEDYLPKPFNATILRARVGASLEKKRLRDQVRASLHRLELELEAARKLQLAMLPRDFPGWSSEWPVEIHASMEPAREVGGDMFDFFFSAGDRLWFMVGDVSGKGASAAMFMARMRSLVRLAVRLSGRSGEGAPTPAAIARIVSRELFEDNADRMFVTLFLGVIDVRTGRVSYSNAGHPRPFVVPALGELRRAAATPQPPLGIRADMEYADYALELAPGEMIAVYSDGVTEAASPDGALMGEERLASLLAAARAGDAAHGVRAIREAIDAHSAGAERSDDVTLLLLRWRPA